MSQKQEQYIYLLVNVDADNDIFILRLLFPVDFF